jgi:hypothetical protein
MIVLIRADVETQDDWARAEILAPIIFGRDN